MTNFKDKVFTFHYRNGNIVGIFAGGIGEYLSYCAYHSNDREELILKNRDDSGKFCNPYWVNYSGREICKADEIIGSADFDPACNIARAIPVKWFELKELIAFIDSDWCESFAEGVEALRVADVDCDDITVAFRALFRAFKDFLLVNPEELVDFVSEVTKWDMEEELEEELLNVVCDGDREKFNEIFGKMF